jgi:hypothetical protein
MRTTVAETADVAAWPVEVFRARRAGQVAGR